jgi:hypothetical protein
MKSFLICYCTDGKMGPFYYWVFCIYTAYEKWRSNVKQNPTDKMLRTRPAENYPLNFLRSVQWYQWIKLYEIKNRYMNGILERGRNTYQNKGPKRQCQNVNHIIYLIWKFSMCRSWLGMLWADKPSGRVSFTPCSGKTSHIITMHS